MGWGVPSDNGATFLLYFVLFGHLCVHACVSLHVVVLVGVLFRSLPWSPESC